MNENSVRFWGLAGLLAFAIGHGVFVYYLRPSQNILAYRERVKACEEQGERETVSAPESIVACQADAHRIYLASR